MKRELAVFYHIWSPPNTYVWRFLVDEQIKRIFRSGLPNVADIFCCISGECSEEIEEYVSLYPWINIIESGGDEGEFEGLTLKYLYEECRSQPNLIGVSYIIPRALAIYHLIVTP